MGRFCACAECRNIPFRSFLIYARSALLVIRHSQDISQRFSANDDGPATIRRPLQHKAATPLVIGPFALNLWRPNPHTMLISGPYGELNKSYQSSACPRLSGCCAIRGQGRIEEGKD